MGALDVGGRKGGGRGRKGLWDIMGVSGANGVFWGERDFWWVFWGESCVWWVKRGVMWAKISVWGRTGVFGCEKGCRGYNGVFGVLWGEQVCNG